MTRAYISMDIGHIRPILDGLISTNVSLSILGTITSAFWYIYL